MKPTCNNLAISFFYYIFLVLGEMMESLLNGLGLHVKMQLMLNQLPRNSR
jgi:hypothetical protein